MGGGEVGQKDVKKISTPQLLRCTAKYCYLQTQWWPQGCEQCEQARARMSVCLCVHASVCVSFVLSNTNCIPYSATYDALKKSRMKHNSKNHFFPRTKSRSLLGSMSWCRRAKAQDLSSLLQTQGDEASLIVLPHVHLKLLVPQDWIMAI